MGVFSGFKKLFANDPAPAPVAGEMSVSDLTTAGLFGGKFTLYNPSELISRRGYTIIDKMRLDEQVKAAMTFKKRTVNVNGWTIVSPDDKPEDWEVTAFVKDTLTEIAGTFDQALNEILLALDYGFSVTEKVWTEKDGKLVLAELKTRKPHNFYFDLDQFGNVVALKQYDRLLPADKFVVLTFDKEFQNPYGVTDLAAAYRSWWSKDNAYKWLSMLLERMGIPPIFMFYNPEASAGQNVGNLQTILKRLQAATVATIPRRKKDDVEPWAPELANNAANVFIPSIDMYDKHISKAVLMPGLIGFSADDAVGSMARAAKHFDSFMLVVSAIRTLVTAAVQAQIVRPLVDMNFAGVDKYPQFQFLPADQDANLEVFKTWLGLASGKAVTMTDDDEKYIRESLKFPEREYIEGERETTNEQPEPEAKPEPSLPDEDKDENRDAEDYALKLLASKAEKRIDYKALGAKMESLDDILRAALADNIKATKERAAKWIAANYAKDDFNPASFELPSALRSSKVFLNAFVQAAELGAQTVTAEVTATKRSYDKGATRPKTLPGETTKKAIKYLKQKAQIVAEKYDQRIQNAVKQTLLTGLKTGDSVGEMIVRVNDALDIEDSAYSETVVRTNITDAMNTARLAQFRDQDIAAGIAAVQYSAILDSRTTEVCQFLHGKLFRVNDSALDEFTPPNHFNCRSVLVPVMIDERPDDDEYITEAEKGKARDLAGDGFL